MATLSFDPTKQLAPNLTGQQTGDVVDLGAGGYGSYTSTGQAANGNSAGGGGGGTSNGGPGGGGGAGGASAGGLVTPNTEF